MIAIVLGPTLEKSHIHVMFVENHSLTRHILQPTRGYTLQIIQARGSKHLFVKYATKVLQEELT